MASLRRPLPLTLVTLGALSLVLLMSLALGADAVSVIVGAATVAVAFAVVVVLWFVPAQRAVRRQRRRDQRAAKRRRRQERQAARKRERDLAQKRDVRMRRIVRAADRQLLVQLETHDWLRDELELTRPLPPTRAFSATPDFLAELVHAIDRTAAETVVELGSGISTIVMARRLQQAGRGRLITLEHLARYAEATRAELAAYGLEDLATVLDAPLVDCVIDTETWPWYELGPGVPERIDVLVVDGPPGTTRPLARYPALPLLRDRLAPGAQVLLDDGDRIDEREVARRWEAEIEGIESEHLPLNKGAWLLTLPR